MSLRHCSVPMSSQSLLVFLDLARTEGTRRLNTTLRSKLKAFPTLFRSPDKGDNTMRAHSEGNTFTEAYRVHRVTLCLTKPPQRKLSPISLEMFSVLSPLSLKTKAEVCLSFGKVKRRYPDVTS